MCLLEYISPKDKLGTKYLSKKLDINTNKHNISLYLSLISISVRFLVPFLLLCGQYIPELRNNAKSIHGTLHKYQL